MFLLSMSSIIRAGAAQNFGELIKNIKEFGAIT
jgi:hypothetical protein